VFGDLPWDFGHVRRFPCEDVSISEQEVDELVLLLVGKSVTDSNGFAGVFGVDLHCLGVLCGLKGSCRLLPYARFGCDLSHGSLDSLQL
jgi:hypothetical protein